MPKRKQQSEKAAVSLPLLRFEIGEAARILRMSRSLLYNRIREGSIHAQKDGGRAYITRAEVERYVKSCNRPAQRTSARSSHRKAHRHAKTTPRS
jgi:excisionase family DNA binding protein